MKTRSNRSFRRKGGKKMTYKRYGGKPGKKWVTAIEAAKKTLKKSRSLAAASETLRQQALTNARKLFGSIGSV
jgi:hypothetical protein